MNELLIICKTVVKEYALCISDIVCCDESFEFQKQVKVYHVFVFIQEILSLFEHEIDESKRTLRTYNSNIETVNGFSLY